jgi:hypothetical protein
MIAVVLPSRGLIYARVEEAIEKMRETHEIKVFRSHDMPIPDAQNFLVRQALKTDASHVLFIEEDTLPPDGALTILLEADADIACMDYSVNGYGCVARNEKTQEILWCGFGCTLVRRNVLETIGNPWFRTDTTLRLNDWTWTSIPTKYGGQDIWFCTQARERGFSIKQVPGECDHLYMVSRGLTESNKGAHLIVPREKITKKQYITVPEKRQNTTAFIGVGIEGTVI